MTLYQTFLLIYIFILSVNGMIMVVDAQLNIGITTPFDINSSISGETPPSIFDPANPSGTLTEDVTTDVDDGGGDDDASGVHRRRRRRRPRQLR